MSNAKHDGNGIPTIIAPSSSDGTIVVLVQVNPSNGGLKITDGTTGTDFGPVNAIRDGNHVTGLIGVSSTDGITPVDIYADSSGHLLIQST